MSQKDDLNTIKQVKRGNTKAFEAIVLKYQRPLFVYIGNIIRHRETVEDVLQDVFTSAFSQIHRYNRFRASFSTWIYRIARNRCLNELARRTTVSQPDFSELTDENTPAEDMLNKEIIEKLDEALESLSFEDRSLFILAEVEGLSYKEISAIEKLKTGTIKSRLSRIRTKVRTSLRKALGETIE